MQWCWIHCKDTTILQAQRVLFHVFVENLCLCADTTKKHFAWLSWGLSRQNNKKESGGTNVCKTCVTVLAMCLRQTMMKSQVFLVTPLCQHFRVAIIKGFSFIETWEVEQFVSCWTVWTDDVMNYTKSTIADSLCSPLPQCFVFPLLHGHLCFTILFFTGLMKKQKRKKKYRGKKYSGKSNCPSA